jgi:hypothetical protein
VALALFAGQASAAPGAYRVLAVYANGGGQPTTLGSQIAAFPDIATVDFFNGQTGTPTAAQLEGYDLVVSMSNSGYGDQVSYGNALADFVDSGGAVVQYAYDNWVGGGTSNGPTGRFASGGYEPFVPGPNPNTASTLGTFDATSPLMQGVNALASDDNTAPALASGATLVAKWADDRNLIAYKGRVVSISASTNESNPFSGDFGRLTVNAVRWLGRHTLTVTNAGSGSGTVTSSPAGINCGASCAANYPYVTQVMLTATAASGSFTGWSGAGCSGTSSCIVTMDAAKAVTATFNACIVPKLKGKSVKTDKRKLQKAGCKLGKVKGPRGKAKVRKQRPKPGTVLPFGAKVKVTT